MKKCYVLVAVDKTTGDLYVSPDMLLQEYSKEEVEHVLKFTPKAIRELRDFHVMPYHQALQLWLQERNERQSKDNKVIH